MISIRVGTNTNRTTVIVPESTTPKQVLLDQNIDFSTAIVHLDGSVIKAAEMNTSFADLGIKDSATLIAVVKTENA